MKNHKLLLIILLSIATVSCSNSEKEKLTFFSFNTSSFKNNYFQSDVVSLEILNPKNKDIDSIIYYVNDIKIVSKNGLEKINLDLKDKKLGYQNLKALVYFEGDNVETTSRIEVVSDIEPKLLTYKIINVYPHDTNSFIEGLEFFRDTLYESAGQYNKSQFFKYDYKTGKKHKTLGLDGKYFGEGITIFNNKIYLLTWKENTGFIYNANTWKLEKTFNYDKKIEGWGMTHDDKFIYHSDGTEKIWKMNPETQKMEGYINVYAGTKKIKSINELEWIDGKIYGNVWQKDAIAVINPLTGVVEGVLELSGLRTQVKNQEAEVLNGIAYNPKTNTIFVTGKNWEKLFEIKVSE
jgi:glutamine cyclotransferase